jgi:hypothetical protein
MLIEVSSSRLIIIEVVDYKHRVLITLVLSRVLNPDTPGLALATNHGSLYQGLHAISDVRATASPC